MFRAIRQSLAAIAFVSTSLFASQPAATAQTFDFESVPATFISPPAAVRPGSLTSLVMVSAGLTVTISRSSGTRFDVVSNVFGQGGKPASWGAHSLDPFFDPFTADFFVADFSKPINSASIDFGDYGDDADLAFLSAFAGLGGTGAVISNTNDALGLTSFPLFHSMSARGAGIRSITFGGGLTPFPNSLFWDNLTVTQAPSAVPETSSLLLLMSGLPVIIFAARRRKR